MALNKLYKSIRIACPVSFLIYLIFKNCCAFGQTHDDSLKRIWLPPSPIYMDTIIAESENCHLIHYHTVSESMRKKMIDMGDDIFIDSLNNFSRLVFKKHRGSAFNIPTLPLSHIYILEKKGVIVCLSNYSVSAYNILLNSTIDGRLLYKKYIGISELKVSKSNLIQIINKYPNIKHCLAQKPNVIKEEDFYYIDFTRCMAQSIGNFDSIIKIPFFIPNRYFPDISSSTGSMISDGRYKKMLYVFDIADPLYDLVMIGTTPYLLVLNRADGEKVNIPLISNCDVLNEIKTQAPHEK